VEVERATVERVRQEFVEGDLDEALERRRPRRMYPRKLDGDGEAYLVALVCQKPPEGRSRWTPQLLADRMVQLEYVDKSPYQTGFRRGVEIIREDPIGAMHEVRVCFIPISKLAGRNLLVYGPTNLCTLRPNPLTSACDLHCDREDE
jgi:hypothetical protein